jgi:hypothetical protein
MFANDGVMIRSLCSGNTKSGRRGSGIVERFICIIFVSRGFFFFFGLLFVASHMAGKINLKKNF